MAHKKLFATKMCIISNPRKWTWRVYFPHFAIKANQICQLSIEWTRTTLRSWSFSIHKNYLFTKRVYFLLSPTSLTRMWNDYAQIISAPNALFPLAYSPLPKKGLTGDRSNICAAFRLPIGCAVLSSPEELRRPVTIYCRFVNACCTQWTTAH